MARRVGVSQSTVSLVFSGKAAGRISARTEAAVRAARRGARLPAERRGAGAEDRARRARSSWSIPDITNPFFGGLLRGAQTAARAAGYAVALIDTDNDRDWGAASAEALHAGPADGLLLFEVDPPQRAAGSEPIVVIESESARPSVRPAGRRAAAPRRRCATCSTLGHTRIGHVASVHDRPDVQAAPPRRRPRWWRATSPRVRTDFTLDAAHGERRRSCSAPTRT